MKTRAQAEQDLKNPRLSDHELEQIRQYLHYLTVENIHPERHAKRPAQKNSHTRHTK
jgi:hypothetical protein